MLAGIWYGIKQERPQISLLKQGDWWGIIAMALRLGSLQIVLEEGSLITQWNCHFILQKGEGNWWRCRSLDLFYE